MNLRAVLAGLTLAGLTACGASGGGASLSSYSSPEALRDALAHAGVACDGFRPGPGQPGAPAGGECVSGDAQLALDVYSDATTVPKVVDEFCPGLAGTTGVYGKNWIVGGFIGPATQVADALGGEACG